MPVRVVIGPASFTLASHVPVFIALFLSPTIAVAVSLGSAVGFLLSGLPIVISMRALSHVIFAYIGAVYLKNRRKEILGSVWRSQVFSFWIALIHGAAEVLVVIPFFFQIVTGAEYQEGFFYGVFMLVGIGTVIHSMVDFVIAQVIWRRLERRMNDL